MVDIYALNLLFWAVTIVSAVVIGTAGAAITTAWLVSRRRHARHITTGLRAAEAHLAEAARDRITH